MNLEKTMHHPASEELFFAERHGGCSLVPETDILTKAIWGWEWGQNLILFFGFPKECECQEEKSP